MTLKKTEVYLLTGGGQDILWKTCFPMTCPFKKNKIIGLRTTKMDYGVFTGNIYVSHRDQGERTKCRTLLSRDWHLHPDFHVWPNKSTLVKVTEILRFWLNVNEGNMLCLQAAFSVTNQVVIFSQPQLSALGY